jgi:hypothetical protein
MLAHSFGESGLIEPGRVVTPCHHVLRAIKTGHTGQAVPAVPLIVQLFLPGTGTKKYPKDGTGARPLGNCSAVGVRSALQPFGPQGNSRQRRRATSYPKFLAAKSQLTSFQ